jgi:hypothetical protein
MSIRVLTGSFRPVLILLALIFSQSALAQAGRILFVSGDATLLRGASLPMAKGMLLEEGDTIVTGGDGRVQMLMSDGDRIAVRPNSRFTIEVFRKPADSVSAGDRPSSWRSFYNLARGGFRTLTQSHGERDENSYRVRTPVATIGIRGTDYSVLYVGEAEEGDLYVGVSDGSVSISNGGGTLDLGNDQYAAVEGSTSEPESIDEPPVDLNDSEAGTDGEWQEPVAEGEGGEDTFSDRRAPGTEGTESDATAPPGDVVAGGDVSVGEPGDAAIQVTGTDPNTGETVDLTTPDEEEIPTPDANRNLAFASGPVGGSPTLTGTNQNLSNTYSFDGAGRLTGFDAGAQHDIGSAANVNSGFDPVTGLKWGRWSGGSMVVTPPGGPAQPIDLSNQSYHWIVGPDTSGPALPVSGSASYTLVGNTDPTDNHGNVGFLGAAHFSADFTNQQVSSGITASVNGQVWDASGTGGFTSGGGFGGSYNSVNVTDGGACSSGCAGNGEFSGFFTDGAQGAGLGYSVEQGGTSVSGTAAFGNPH